MMSERSERYDFGCVDTETLCISLRGVGLAVYFKSLGNLAEICIENALKTLLPCC